MIVKNLGILVFLGSVLLKEEFFFNVYIYVFELFFGNMKKIFFSGFQEIFENVIIYLIFFFKVKVYCLFVVLNLLKEEKVMKVFFIKRGVGQICRMLDDNVLRVFVLKVFEVLVILDEVKEREFDNSLEIVEESKLKVGMVIFVFIDGFVKKIDMSLFLYFLFDIKYQKDLCKLSFDNKYI